MWWKYVKINKWCWFYITLVCDLVIVVEKIMCCVSYVNEIIITYVYLNIVHCDNYVFYCIYYDLDYDKKYDNKVYIFRLLWIAIHYRKCKYLRTDTRQKKIP